MFWNTALTMKSYGRVYVMYAFSCVWPLNGVTIRQIFSPLIVVLVNGVGVPSRPAPPAAGVPGGLSDTAAHLDAVRKPRAQRDVEEVVDARHLPEVVRLRDDAVHLAELRRRDVG